MPYDVEYQPNFALVFIPLIMGLIFFIIGIALIIIKKKKKNRCYTGTSADIKRESPIGINICYYVNGKEYVKTIYHRNTFVRSKDSIEIYYNKDNPIDMYIPISYNFFMTGMLILSLFSAIAMVFISISMLAGLIFSKRCY